MRLHLKNQKVSKLRALRSWQIRLLGISLIVALFASIIAASARTETYEFISKWGSLGSGEGQFDHPYDVVLDSSENASTLPIPTITASKNSQPKVSSSQHGANMALAMANSTIAWA